MMDKRARSSRIFLAIGILGFAIGAYADYFSNAENYYQKKQYPAAVIELKNLLQKDAEHGEARLLLGRTYLAQGDYAAAEKELRRAMALGIKGELTALPLATTLLRQRKTEEALALLDAQEFTEPDAKSEALALKGYLKLADQDRAAAETLFDQALAEAELPFALLGRARLAIMDDRPEDGLADIEKALNKDPGFVEALLVKGQVLGSQQKYQEAAQVYQQVIDQHDQHLGARLALAETYIKLQQPDKAQAEVEKVLEKNANHPVANFIMARIQLDAKQYEQAQISAEKVLRMVPDHATTFYVLGTAHYAQNNLEQAKLYLRKFTSLQPKNIAAARVLAATYMRLGDPASAVELLAALDESHQHQDAQLLSLLGRAYLSSGEFEAGVETLHRAIDIDPDIQGVRTQIALANLLTGDTGSAVDVLEASGAEGDASTQIMLVLSYLKQREFDKAFTAVNQGMTDYPDNIRFPHLKGLIYEAQGDTQQARSLYQNILEDNENYLPVLSAIAKLDAAEGDYESAKAYYLKALDSSPGHLGTQLALARIHESQGDQEKMLEWVRKARQSNLNAVQPVDILVNYYLRHGMQDKALNEARQFQSENPDNRPVLSLLARIRLARGEREDAEFALQKLIGQNDKDITHRMLLAQLYADDQRVEDALQLIEQVLRQKEDHLGALHAKARLFILGERYDDAEQQVDKITTYYPDAPLVPQLKGDLLAAQDQIDQAIGQYEQAFAQAKTAYLANRLFQGYQQTGKLAQAAERLAEYVAIQPQDYGARLRLASAYHNLDNKALAKQHYEKLLAQQPDNPIVLNNLAWLHWLERDQRSLEYARRAHEAAPEQAEITDTLGWVMLHLGDPQEALDLIREASSKAPTNPEIRYHLAVALERNNDIEQARKELTRLLRDHSGFSDEERAKALLDKLNNG